MATTPRTFRVSIAGGIDAVGDLALGDGKHVVYMENINVRSGKAVPFNMPLINPNVVTDTQGMSIVGAVQVFSYRGRVVFSTKRRDYAAEYMDDRERIYWTEYGGNPQKMIEGTVVPIGINRPYVPPSAGIGAAVSPSNITVVVTPTGGTLAKDTNVTFRLAYQTAYGILPPSGVIKPTISVDGSSLVLSWSNPTMDTPATQILLFAGVVGGDERYLATLGAKATSYAYSSTLTPSGEAASLYDQAISFEYATTFLRDVEGVQDESGPSSVSPPILSSSSRKITLSPWSEGLLDSPNAITWGSPYPSFQLISGDNLPGSGVANALTVNSIVKDAQSGEIICTFSTPHSFLDAERILIVGCSPDPFNALPVEIQVKDGDTTTCNLLVGASFVPPGLALTGVTAYRVYQVGISTMYYDPEAGVVNIITDAIHTFGPERVVFSGFLDGNWNDEIDVLPDPNNGTRLFVEGKSLPTDTVFTSCKLTRALTSVALTATGATGPLPLVDDILYFDMTTTGSTGATGAAVKDAFAVKAAPAGAYLVNAAIAGATGASGPIYASGGFQFIPHNDYITHRRIYRGGGTTLFQLCKELPLDKLEFLDALPDAGLGVVLPTLYTENGVGVVYGPAPFGLKGLTTHYGMGFAWEPASNRLRWTPVNAMDAWPEEFYKDFDYRILAVRSFNQALCVFCEDGVYRMEGTEATLLQRHKTKAAPCRAGGSVQFLGNAIVYLSDEGLGYFNGQEWTCMTDLRIPGDFWLANSRYLEGSDPGCYLVPWTQNAAYERLRGTDLPAVTPRYLMPYLVQHVNQEGIRSFIKYGKYYLYWGGDFSQYQAQTMICIDFKAPGQPITVIGVKAQDAFVDETERVHMLLTVPATGSTGA